MRELEKLALGGKDAIYERLLQREKELAEARGIKNHIPGSRMSVEAPASVTSKIPTSRSGAKAWSSRVSSPGAHPAMEKEIIKGTGPGIAQKVKYHTLGKLRRTWAVPGKYRMLRRAGLLGGAAGLGLLGTAWYRAAKNDKALKAQAAQREAAKFGAQFDYAPNAPVTPKPAKFPKMPAPMSTNAGKPDVPVPPKNTAKTEAYTGESAEMKVATASDLLAKIAFLDDGALPWIAGAAGGAGGYYAGKKIIDPLINASQENLRRKIRITEQLVDALEKGKKIAPFAGATVGAILLAALAAKRAKQKEREAMARILEMGGPEREGFDPRDRRSIGDPLAVYYG